MVEGLPGSEAARGGSPAFLREEGIEDGLALVDFVDVDAGVEAEVDHAEGPVPAGGAEGVPAKTGAMKNVAAGSEEHFGDAETVVFDGGIEGFAVVTIFGVGRAAGGKVAGDGADVAEDDGLVEEVVAFDFGTEHEWWLVDGGCERVGERNERGNEGDGAPTKGGVVSWAGAI
jgi:hypothetical protein